MSLLNRRIQILAAMALLIPATSQGSEPQALSIAPLGGQAGRPARGHAAGPVPPGGLCRLVRPGGRHRHRRARRRGGGRRREQPVGRPFQGSEADPGAADRPLGRNGPLPVEGGFAAGRFGSAGVFGSRPPLGGREQAVLGSRVQGPTGPVSLRHRRHCQPAGREGPLCLASGGGPAAPVRADLQSLRKIHGRDAPATGAASTRR